MGEICEPVSIRPIQTRYHPDDVVITFNGVRLEGFVQGPFTFSGRVPGAIHTVNIKGVVSV